MDNKRKAASSTGAGDGDDRAAKRRKVPGPHTDYDLSKGETHESTTAHGLHFLEMIRKTKDKSGRIVSGYFEELLPREGNEEYYRRIRMPISLKTIERRLHNQDFANMSELESYFKRMITNAKEFYPKNSEKFEDAERVRKALSNYMTKNNPAYKLIPGYACVATPIPDDIESEPEPAPAAGNTREDDDAEEDEDAEGEEDDAEDEADDSEDEEEEEEEDEDGGRGGRRKIVLKSRKPGRGGRGGGGTPARGGRRNARAKADHEYENVPYKGLSFQAAQEKIVEELIRKPDGTDPYFLDFINLPPRSFKDYFAVISQPLSLKGLQKLVKGIHGRNPATGVSDFKSWAAFEEKASLLWSNAHYYNEEGSLIYNLATELKECFEKELNEAKAVVQEPPQPKIKIKVPPGQETPTIGPKKITIHVGGSRGSTAASPAPPTGLSSDSNRTDALVNGNRSIPPPAAAPGPGVHPAQLDKSNSLSASASPAVKTAKVEANGQVSPVSFPRINGNGPNVLGVPNGNLAQTSSFQQAPTAAAPLLNGHAVVAPPPPPRVYNEKRRAPGRGVADALIQSILVRTHPQIPLDRRFRLELPADPKLAHQNVTVHVAHNHHRLQLIPRLQPLEQQQRQYRLWVTCNNQPVGRATPLPIPDDPLPANAIVFDLALHPGTTNLIAVTMVAALPKGQKLPNGAEVEIEKVTLNIHVSKS